MHSLLAAHPYHHCRCSPNNSDGEEEEDVDDKEGGEMGTTGIRTKVRTRVMIKLQYIQYINLHSFPKSPTSQTALMCLERLGQPKNFGGLKRPYDDYTTSTIRLGWRRTSGRMARRRSWIALIIASRQGGGVGADTFRVLQ